uniref:Uncharacterized protein n=1 Tax=Avena sativa TaxID=4498 RepID=A0ACD5ZAR8_AVESA
MPPPAPHLVDEILEEIFFRLPTPAALARASTASPHFRRIITERSFLRRYRKRHPPPLLGFVDEFGFHPAQASHSPAPIARALADAADFTYSFVPKPSNGTHWRPRDVCDGRVLLDDGSRFDMFKNLAVCDPLSQRYTLLPPIPMDQEKAPCEIKPILAPIGEEDETSFKVICVANFETKLVAFVFSFVAPEWSIATSTSWTSLGSLPFITRFVPYSECCSLSRFDYAHGRFYSASPWNDKLLVLDKRKLEFSTVSDVLVNDIQTGIVVGKEGALEMFSLVDDHSLYGSSDLHHTSQQNNCEPSNDWHLENIISLPDHYDYFTLGAAEGFLFLEATKRDTDDEGSPVTTDLDVDYFSLEVRTSELMEVCRMKKPCFDGLPVYWYFGFPPSLSKPSI